jgi:hypothetical protein
MRTGYVECEILYIREYYMLRVVSREVLVIIGYKFCTQNMRNIED